jgi:hypothetical protein
LKGSGDGRFWIVVRPDPRVIFVNAEKTEEIYFFRLHII